MKQTHTSREFYLSSVSDFNSDLLPSSGEGNANKLHKIYITPKQNVMKTILTLLAVFFIYVSSFSQVTSFSARLKDDKINLNWSTLGAKDISHFYVEKSYDGKSFKQVGVIFAFDNDTEAMNYPFTDKVALADKTGMIYYRLSTIGADGNAELLQVRKIFVGNKTKEALGALSTYQNSDKI
ncbi:MAG: hypothetical protein ACSLE0_15670 [Chitinophagaceae bacterium]